MAINCNELFFEILYVAFRMYKTVFLQNSLVLFKAER